MNQVHGFVDREFISGGSVQEVEPTLVLQKEDTTVYQAFLFFRKRVSLQAWRFYNSKTCTSYSVLYSLKTRRRTGELDLTTTGMEKSGKINSAFYDMEMDKWKRKVIFLLKDTLFSMIMHWQVECISTWRMSQLISKINVVAKHNRHIQIWCKKYL